MTESDDESRANRLRNRRQRSRSSQQEQEPAENETDEPGETDKPSEPSKTSKPSKSEGSGGKGVKDTQVGTYMYLPEPLADELAYQFKLTSAEYERELGEEMEKNRHWYPLVIELGLEQIEEMDPEAMHDRLQQSGGE